MTGGLPRDGLVAVVKRDCPTCVLTAPVLGDLRSEEHTSELQSHLNLVCRLLLEKNNTLRVATVETGKDQTPTATAQNAVAQTPPRPLVWPCVAKLQPRILSPAPHTHTSPHPTAL